MGTVANRTIEALAPREIDSNRRRRSPTRSLGKNEPRRQPAGDGANRAYGMNDLGPIA